MQFNRLRLQGFKSFVEPTNLDIPAGLTGIVGPNGCGKSNLVEALRWVMGENSPRRMRGAEMDDVIFAGTATRVSRNLAEVSLDLDNSSRSATAEFNDSDEISVTRIIERGSGSDYRINGKPVRQRDVQLLFADQATGAHSTNLVGQGQIDALIRAKPQDRRQILEEASGTAGLQARRHEAELKLKAAEQNLSRLDDVLRTYDTQLRSLKQQVKQASRYRNLAEHIRRTEAGLLHLKWLEAEENSVRAKEALAEAERLANDLLATVTRGHTARTEITAELPALRQAEAAAAAIVQKLTLAREQIEAEEARIVEETAAQERLQTEARDDRAREEARLSDGEAAIAKLESEQQQLTRTHQDISAQLPLAEESFATISAEVETLDSALAQLVQEAASVEAQRHALQQETENLAMRQASLAARRSELDGQRTHLAAEMAARPDLALASAMVDASEKELTRRQSQAHNAEAAYREADQNLAARRDDAHQTNAELTRLKAEAAAIDSMLAAHDQQTQQIIDLVTVAPGFEQALAVALGEALTAALEESAPTYWRALPSFATDAPLPESIASLAAQIGAPAALARALSQIGLVEDAETGARLSAALSPGQTLVSRDGWAWRWDGYTVTPQAKTSSAVRMQQRNRRAALADDIAQAAIAARTAEEAAASLAALCQERHAEDKAAREALQAAFAALNDARDLYNKQEKEATAAAAKLSALDETLAQISAEQHSVRERLLAIEEILRALPDGEAAKSIIAEARLKLAAQRNTQAQKQSERDHLRREQTACETRRATVTEDIAAWHSRAEGARHHIAALAERIEAIEAQLTQLRSRPAELAEARGRLLGELTDAEAKRSSAADTLIAAEQRLSVVEHQIKRDEAALGEAREARVRAEGAVCSAAEHFTVLRERMTEKLSCAPEELPAIAALEPDAAPSAFELEQSLGKYVRERDTMGPVNLRAEAEAETVQGEMDKLQAEKDDLVAAIAKLRQGISQLNREARERLQNAFGAVNERFQTLFKRLFDGGKAHLEFIDDEDPLNAGLEIFASPPGKKMQILSLLSGGERTLTALALLFAVFQTNPSPICVLDEAEAALDESNIGRFCGLVEDIARETGTRFLIITHQRLTMARMDRLYGVTMSEKGVSQLVSVDLAGAVALRDGEHVGPLVAAKKALEEVAAA